MRKKSYYIVLSCKAIDRNSIHCTCIYYYFFKPTFHREVSILYHTGRSNRSLFFNEGRKYTSQYDVYIGIQWRKGL